MSHDDELLDQFNLQIEVLKLRISAVEDSIMPLIDMYMDNLRRVNIDLGNAAEAVSGLAESIKQNTEEMERGFDQLLKESSKFKNQLKQE